MNTFLKFRLKPSILNAVVGGFLAAVTIALGVVGPATAWADDDHGLKAVPGVFIGTVANCGIAGSRIVTAKWLKGMGLPDNGGQNTTPSDLTTNPNKNDRHSGLLLSKNGPTPDCSAAGAEIKGVKGKGMTAPIVLGFDYRNGTHCGSGAPRFNVVVTPPSGPDTSHFVGGCANDGTPAAAPQDPLQWTRVRFQTSNASESFPVIPAGSKIRSIDIIFDEGTDTGNAPGEIAETPGIPGTGAAGLAVIDNIFINGVFITRERGEGHHDGKDHDDDDDD